MGRLSNGTPYLTQRGLATLCGVRNAHIGTISRDWMSEKPRIVAIKARLDYTCMFPHQVLNWEGHRQHVYSMAICRAILDYYALDAGDRIQQEAQANRLKFQQESLETFILKRLAPAPLRRSVLRFKPLSRIPSETYECVDAFVSYLCGLFALSAWMANSHCEGLRQRAMNASWNRLGLYLPLKAMLEIQAEALLRINGTFTVR